MSQPFLPQPMIVRLFNTLTGQLDPLEPMDGKALRMYACGPTVYDYGHIGNFRTFLQIDILRRFLRLSGMAVRHVMNITDVDDKIIRNAAAAGIPIGEYTARMWTRSSRIWRRCAWSGRSTIARATEHIPQMVALVEKLAAAGAAYKAEDGSWYFRLAVVSRVRQAEQERPERHGRRRARGRGRVREGLGARLCAVESAPSPARLRGIRRSGAGRPGWHIECSAMAMEYLGESFDLHCGRRRPDVSAPRKRDCAERDRDAQALCAALDARALPAGGRAQDVEERRATSTPCATCC